MSLIVHIGLGKTATTTLQKHVFPLLRSEGVIPSYNPRAVRSKLADAVLRLSPDDDLQAEIACLPSGTLISMEQLSGWNPATWTEHYEFNRAMFPRDSRILITLRDPESYLSSVYQQMVQQGNVVKPRDFFLDAKRYEAAKYFAREYPCEIYAIDEFSLQRLVEMYRSSFETVVVVPIEALADMEFLHELFAIPNMVKEKAKGVFNSASVQNRSYSRLAMRLTFGRERIFNVFGARSLNSFDDMFLAAVGCGYVRLPNRSKWRKRVLGVPFPTWRYIMQFVVDRIIDYQKYRLPVEIGLGVHHQENKAYYEVLKRERLHPFSADGASCGVK